MLLCDHFVVLQYTLQAMWVPMEHTTSTGMLLSGCISLLHLAWVVYSILQGSALTGVLASAATHTSICIRCIFSCSTGSSRTGNIGCCKVFSTFHVWATSCIWAAFCVQSIGHSLGVSCAMWLQQAIG